MEEIVPRPSLLVYLPLGKCKSSFSLEKAVCNHGFFMMAPNKWIPSVKALQRPLRMADNCANVVVTICHPPHDANVHIYVHHLEALSSQNQQAILDQVGRMLRINDKDEIAVNDFQELHPQAKNAGFGRIFRSPSIFEDAVKSVLLTNCTWRRTLDMAKSLCKLQLQLSIGSQQSVRDQGSCKRKRGQKKAKRTKVKDKCSNESSMKFIQCEDNGTMGNFPTSGELANLNQTYLQEHCNLGFRARYIINLAQMVESEKLDLEKFERELGSCSFKRIQRKLSTLKGFGPFAVANVLMCMGCYQKVPADSETIRHLKQVHGILSCSFGTIQQHVEELYNKYAPFQCIAYWFELINYYEESHGKLSELNESDYHCITGYKKLPVITDASKS